MRGPPSAAGALTNTTGVAKAVTFGPLYLGPPPYAVNAVTSGVSAILRRPDQPPTHRPRSVPGRPVDTGTPNDEMQLAYRKTLSASEKNGSAIAGFVDQCPDEALGAYLYTNAISGGDTVQNGSLARLGGSQRPSSGQRPTSPTFRQPDVVFRPDAPPFRSRSASSLQAPPELSSRLETSSLWPESRSRPGAISASTRAAQSPTTSARRRCLSQAPSDSTSFRRLA